MRLSKHLIDANPVAAARLLMAVALATTLIVTPAYSLFDPQTFEARCGASDRYLLFCLAGPGNEWVAAIGAIAVCVLIAAARVIRTASLLYAYVALSFVQCASGIDGGDAVNANLSMLLVPISLARPDLCRWRGSSGATVTPMRTLIAGVALFGIKLQMMVIYFDAAITKVAVQEWRDGTALFYVLSHPVYGGLGVWPILGRLTGTELIVFITWGAIGVEFLLAFAWLASWEAKRAILWLGVAFHIAIGVIHGLPSFAAIMIAGLLLYLRVPRIADLPSSTPLAADTSKVGDLGRLLHALNKAETSMRET